MILVTTKTHGIPNLGGSTRGTDGTRVGNVTKSQMRNDRRESQGIRITDGTRSASMLTAATMSTVRGMRIIEVKGMDAASPVLGLQVVRALRRPGQADITSPHATATDLALQDESQGAPNEPQNMPRLQAYTRDLHIGHHLQKMIQILSKQSSVLFQLQTSLPCGHVVVEPAKPMPWA